MTRSICAVCFAYDPKDRWIIHVTIFHPCHFQVGSVSNLEPLRTHPLIEGVEGVVFKTRPPPFVKNIGRGSSVVVGLGAFRFGGSSGGGGGLCTRRWHVV